MATDERLRYLIEAIWKGRSATLEAQRDIKDVGTAGEKGQSGIKTFNDSLGKITGIAAGAAGAIKVFKTAFEFGEQGAALNKVEERFDALNESIGAVADDTLKRLQDAVDGSVPKMELMAQSNLLLSTGAASSADELVQMVENIVKLKKPTEDAGTAIENFALLLANKSIPRLDTYGLSAANVKKRYEELKATMDDDAAFRTAVFEEMAVSLEKVGEGGDYTADAFTRARVKTQDLTDSFKQFMADGLGPVVDLLFGGYADKIEDITKKNIEQATSLDDLKNTYRRYSETLENTSGLTLFLTGAGKNIIEGQRELERQIAINVDSFEDYITAGQELGFIQQELNQYAIDYARFVYDEARAQESLKVAVLRTADEEARRLNYVKDTSAATLALLNFTKDLAGGIDLLKGVVLKATIAAEEHEQAMLNAANAAAAQAEKTRDLEYAIGSYFDQALTATEETKSLEMRLYESAAQAGLTAEQLVVLASATGEFTDAEIQAAFEAALMQARIDELVTAVQAGTMSADDAVVALQKLRDGQADAGEAALNHAGNLKDVAGQAENAKDKILKYREELEKIPEFVSTQVNAIVNWMNGGGLGAPAPPAKPTDKDAENVNNWQTPQRVTMPSGGGTSITIYVDATGATNPASVQAAGYSGVAAALKAAGVRASQIVRMR